MSRSDVEQVLRVCADLAVQFAKTAGDEDQTGRFAPHKAELMREAGLSAFTVPEALGGMGAGVWDQCLALESLAGGDGSIALGAAMHFHAIGSAAQQRAWRPDALAALCAECVSPGIFVNAVFSEPEMGSPSRGGMPATQAIPTPGGYRITGRKRWATFAPALDYFLISAATPDSQGPCTGIFAVRGHTPGITLIDTWGDGLSLRASGSCDVELADVFVPENRLLETRGSANTRPDGLPPAWGACAFAAVYLGIGRAALVRFTGFARERIPTAFGRPIAELPAIQRASGQISVALRAARALLREVAQAWDCDPEHRQSMGADVAAAKLACINASITATELALRASGANGLDRRLGIERLFRDARAGLIQPPQEDLALEIIGRAALADEMAWRN